MTSTHAHAAQTGDMLVVEPQRFAIVPEWVLDLEVSDAALRLYALLLRYGGTSGSRMPSRRLLAERMRRSVDSVDRAMRDLETAGLVRVERRRRGRENLTNRYHVRTTNPADRRPPAVVAERAAEADRTHDATEGGGRRSAATRTAAATGTPAARGTAAARVAADLRPNRKQETQSPPPPTPPPRRPPRARAAREEEPTTDRSDEVLARCGITDLGCARRALPNRTTGARPVPDPVGRPVPARRHPARGAARLATRADRTRPADSGCGPGDPFPDAGGRSRTVVGPTPTPTARARRGRPRRAGGRARRHPRAPTRPPSQSPAGVGRRAPPGHPGHRHRPRRPNPPPIPTGSRMTPAPLPLVDAPHGTVRPPGRRPTEDHRTHLSGGARYAFGEQMRRVRLRRPTADRARSPLPRPVT